MKDGKRLLIFLVTGGLAAGVNVVSRIVLSQVMNYEAAVAVAYLFGMTTAFVLARRLVFDASGRHVGGEFGRFALVNAVAFAQVWLVSIGLALYAFPALGFTWHAETIAHVIGVASPVLTSYYAHKHFSFGSKPASRDGVKDPV